MMTIGPLEEDILSPSIVEYSRRMCGIYMDCVSTPVKSTPVADSVVHFKILVPGVAAGAIIGKGGETIAQLQRDAGARVKMSKANDFYPGTTERICLITGSVESVLYVLRFVQEKIRDKPDLNAKPAIDYDSKLIVDRDRQVKILVPNSTAGMVIGKAGGYIRQVKEESGAYVQISQKAKDQTLSERCITVIGDTESCRRACLLILQKVCEDPQSGSCLNVSYADVHGPVANFNPTGSPFAISSAAGGGGCSPTSTTFNTVANSSDHFVCAPVMMQGGLRLELRAQCASNTAGHHLSTHALDHIHNTLRASGYSEQAASEVTAAIDTLSRYGIMGVSVVPPPATPDLSAQYPHPPYHHSHQCSSDSPSVPDLPSLFNHPSEVLSPVSMSGGGGCMTSPLSSCLQASQNCAAGCAGDSPCAPTAACARYTAASTVSLPVNHNSYGLGTVAQALALRQTDVSPCPSPPSCVSPTLPCQTALAAPPPPTPQQQHTDGGQHLQIAHTPPSHHHHHHQQQVDASVPDCHRQDLEVGDHIIGAVLGPGGRDLAEIQRLSGAIIQISKKGAYRPSTRHRLVAICGGAQAVATAHYLIEQKISEEEAKRARHSASLTSSPSCLLSSSLLHETSH